MRWGLLIIASVAAPNLFAMDLEHYLQEVQKKNAIFRSLEQADMSVQGASVKGDLELSPMLNAKASYLNDQKPSSGMMAALYGDKTIAKDYSLGVAQKFSTGTALSLSADVTEATLYGVAINPLNLNAGYTNSTSATSALSLGFSQSIWKDGFGRATALRHERESLVEKAQRAGLRAQVQQMIITAEAAYWDLIYLQQELKLRQDSLARAKKLEAWMQKRENDGVAERSDLVQMQALVATREMQLLMTQDNLKAAQKAVANQLEVSIDQVPSLEGDVESKRGLKQLVANSGDNQKAIRLDVYASQLEAQAKKAALGEVEDGLRPDLSLEGKYSTNGLDSSMSSVSSKLSDVNNPTMAVALKFTYIFDTSAKKSMRSSAAADAMSSEYKAQRLQLEGESSWDELNRRHKELNNQILAADRIAKLQNEKARLESDKLHKGRTITLNVVQSEQDAADSELNLAKMKAEQRKLEAQARLFMF